jgi:uncharacterized membrane protein YciS (DUF1049 family)
MRKGALGFIIGLITGLVSAYIFYRNKKQILEKLSALEKQIKNLEVKEKIRKNATEIVSSLKKFTDEAEEVTDKEKEILLNKVEEKIRKLEEVIK